MGHVTDEPDANVPMVHTPRTLPVIQPGRKASPPIFPKIGIVGLGLIGGSIALAARQTWPSGFVIAVDDNSVLEKAMVLHIADIAANDPVVLAEADLVILATPVRQNIALLGELVDHLPGSAVITDVGSTKHDIVEAARMLPPRLTFVGGHPLGGAARSGIEHARADLFAGRPWIFTPTGDGAGAVLERLYTLTSALGAKPFSMDPDVHDKLMASLSHLPQLVATALMHVIGERVGEDGLALAGRGLADTTRLASSPGSIWRDICATNVEEIAGALDELIGVLDGLRRDLESGSMIEDVFASANKWRTHLSGDRTPRTGSPS